MLSVFEFMKEMAAGDHCSIKEFQEYQVSMSQASEFHPRGDQLTKNMTRI